MITITIVTKNDNDRKKIRAQLSDQDDFSMADTGKDGYDALISAMTRHPDIIIMDFSMEDICGPDLAPIVKRHSPTTSLIALCSTESIGTAVSDAIKRGVSGYLYKEEIADHLALAIRCVHNGGLYISKSMRDQTIHNVLITSQETESLHTGERISKPIFTNTELQILYGIICGHTDREIAKNLNMSSGSLRNCISHAKRKTGLHNRTQISTYALLTGIINVEKIKDSFKRIG